MGSENFIFRIDDRLIHGQVTLGWVKPLALEKIYLVDDACSGDPLSCRLWETSMPPKVELHILSKEMFARECQKIKLENSLLLVRNIETAVSIVSDCGVIPEYINLGGIHYCESKKEILPWLFLSASEMNDIKKLLCKGIRVVARAVCNSKEVIIDRPFLEKFGECDER